MKFYLAAKFSKYKILQGVKRDLEIAGHTVTSRWIDSKHSINTNNMTQREIEHENMRFALEDIDDLYNADSSINFTQEPTAEIMRGGRHVEFGISLHIHKRIFVIGPRENIFHCLPAVEHYIDYLEFKRCFLLGMERREKWQR